MSSTCWDSSNGFLKSHLESPVWTTDNNFAEEKQWWYRMVCIQSQCLQFKSNVNVYVGEVSSREGLFNRLICNVPYVLHLSGLLFTKNKTTYSLTSSLFTNTPMVNIKCLHSHLGTSHFAHIFTATSIPYAYIASNCYEVLNSIIIEIERLG